MVIIISSEYSLNPSQIKIKHFMKLSKIVIKTSKTNILE